MNIDKLNKRCPPCPCRPIVCAIVGGNGGNEKTAESFEPKSPPILSVTSTNIEGKSLRQSVTYAYSIPNLREFLGNLKLDFVTDSVEIVVATTQWGEKGLRDQDIVAKQRLNYVADGILSASGSGFILTKLSREEGTSDRKWCILIRAAGSSKADGSTMPSVTADVGVITFEIPAQAVST